MRDTLPAFLRHLADRRSPRTIRTYGSILESFEKFLVYRVEPTAPFTRVLVEAFLARPRHDGERRAPAGRNQDLAALRAFAKFAQRDLGWTTNPTEGIPFAREAPRDPAVLTAGELRQLFLAASTSGPARNRSRNLAILAVLSQAALRVHELVALDVFQVDLATGTLLQVAGKGGTVHDIPLNTPAAALVSAWLADRPHLVEAGEPALFVAAHGKRISIRAVERLVQRLREAVGSAKHTTPHTLRHTAATLSLAYGTDLSTVGDLLRHEDLNTTRRYLHLVDTRRREAVRRLEGTVPLEVLPASLAGPTFPYISTAKVSLPADLQGLLPPVSNPLDDQYGLVAPFLPERRPRDRQMATNTTITTRARQGACFVPVREPCSCFPIRCDGKPQGCPRR